MDKLTSCPFCGGEAKVIMFGDVCVADCKVCHSQGAWGEDEEKAAKLWNRRAPQKLRPMEDIPRDTSWILLYFKGNQHNIPYVAHFDIKSNQWTAEEEDMYGEWITFRDANFIGWLPLPEVEVEK